MNDKVVIVGGHSSLTTLCKMAVQHRPAPLDYVVTDRYGDRGVVVDAVYDSEKKRPAGVSLAGLFGLKKTVEGSDEPQRG